MLSGSYTEEQNQIAAGIPQKEADVQRLRETVSGTDGFLDKAQRYTDITELTPELLRLFIEKIVVHEKEVKWSKHAPQTVEIHYNGIGYVGSNSKAWKARKHWKQKNPDRHRKHNNLSGGVGKSAPLFYCENPQCFLKRRIPPARTGISPSGTPASRAAPQSF